MYVVQMMPLPLTFSYFSKIQIGFTFVIPAHPGSLGQRADKRVCVCVHVQVCLNAIPALWHSRLQILHIMLSCEALTLLKTCL